MRTGPLPLAAFLPLFACAMLASPPASAQSPALPDSISGRWTWVQRGVGQTFSVDRIAVQPDRSFTARFTWWTIDPKCVIRDVPITGTLTGDGLSFEAITPCNVPFRVDLRRAQPGWTGTATSTGGAAGGNAIVMELKAG